jgi:hypothetical protein
VQEKFRLNGSAIKNAIWYSESETEPNTIVRFDPKTEKFQSWAIPAAAISCATPMSRKTATSCQQPHERGDAGPDPEVNVGEQRRSLAAGTASAAARFVQLPL